MTLPAASPAELRCPGCGAGGLVDVFEMRGLPVFVGILHDEPGEARRAPTGEVTLAWCGTCGLVHNRTHDPARVDFRPGYEVSLSHSATFRTYIHGVADRLVARHGLEGARVLEIGCGDGYFLRLLAERGIGEGIGVDPTVARAGEETVAGARIEWVRDYYDPTRYADVDPDFVASLSVFEDIPVPAAFLRALRSTLRPEARLYFEVYNAWHAFENEETWSVHYEQCNLFGSRSLAGVFARAGFDVLDGGTSYEGDQYAWVEASPGAGDGVDSIDANGTAVADPSDDGPGGGRSPAAPDPPAALARFAARHEENVERWSRRLASHAAAGRRVILWGSGGKGITFLNVVPGADAIVAVADINPDRQGRYIPGTGQPIVAPGALPALEPDVAILTNALYEREIRAQAEGLGLRCAFEVA